MGYDTAEAAVLAERNLRLPQWSPWVLSFLLCAFHDAFDGLYAPALFASLGLGLYATAQCLLIGFKCRSQTRAYWFMGGSLTLDLGVSPVSLFVEYLPLLLFLLFIPLFLVAGALRPDRPKLSLHLPIAFGTVGVVGLLLWWASAASGASWARAALSVLALLLIALLILLVERLWFSQSSSQGAWQRIHGHLASALMLWYVSVFVVFASHGRNGILVVIPPIWIIWTTRVARRLVVEAPLSADTSS